ncbi:MAG: hypothetical protein JWQ49_3106 [Edaphobacter sp.]|nr:hypothetical protein [Edaphobacter sp.]
MARPAPRFAVLIDEQMTLYGGHHHQHARDNPDGFAPWSDLVAPVLIHGKEFPVHGKEFPVHGKEFPVHGKEFPVHGKEFPVN